MPLGELYRLTGGWDGVREALGITMCTLSYKECKDCRGLENIRAFTNNRKNINATIRRHQYEVHGIPYPQQQQQQPSKKQKISNGVGGPPLSDEDSNDGAIEGFVF